VKKKLKPSCGVYLPLRFMEIVLDIQVFTHDWELQRRDAVWMTHILAGILEKV